MTEGVENRGSEEAQALVLEVARDEFSKCRVSKIKYPRALLLGLSEVEVCCKLPGDFDLLILRQLDEGSNVAVERRGIIGKESHSLRDFCLEKKENCLLLPQISERDAGVLCCKKEKTGVFHLSKTVNPYCPPHLIKTPTFYEPGVQSPGEPDNKGSADDIAGDDKPGKGYSLAGVRDLTKEPLITYEAFRGDNEEQEVTTRWKNEGSKEAARLQGLLKDSASECEDAWKKNEGSKATACLEGLLKDSESSFDEFWEEILETIHNLPDEQSLYGLQLPENLYSLNLDEIDWADKDGLILTDNMKKNSESGHGAKLEEANFPASQYTLLDQPKSVAKLPSHLLPDATYPYPGNSTGGYTMQRQRSDPDRLQNKQSA